MPKINIISTGGCGANVALTINNHLSKIEKGSNFPEISYLHIDTSVANKDISSQYGASFHHIKSNKIGEEGELSGSGALRSSNVKSTIVAINEFLNENKSIMAPNTINIIVTSASGGSGSVISPLLSRVLLDKDVPFLVIVIGDDSNLTYATNTSDTLKTYHSIAKTSLKTIPMYYINNSEMDNDFKTINAYVAGVVITMSMFYVGTNVDIDFADMSTFLRIDKMRPKLSIPSGIMSLEVVSGDDTKHIEDDSIMSARILNGMFSTGALNEKTGTITDTAIVEALESKNNTPIVIYSMSGKMTDRIDTLATRISELDIAPEEDNIETDADDDGLVL